MNDNHYVTQEVNTVYLRVIILVFLNYLVITVTYLSLINQSVSGIVVCILFQMTQHTLR